MIPHNANLTIYQGATWTQKIVWRDAATRNIVNLAGYSARMQVRTTAESGSVVIELTTGNSRITLGTASGSITLALTADETAAIAAGSYVYDVELVSGPVVTRVVQGAFNCVAEVTR